MKKTILSLVAVIAMAFGFASCEHQSMRSMEITIYPNQWVTTSTTPYYFATVNWDELDGDVIDWGTVNAYLIQGGRQNSLPLVTPITYYYDNDNDGIYDQEYTVAENIRFDIEYGMITFIIQDLDGELPEDMSSTSPLTFRVVAIGD